MSGPRDTGRCVACGGALADGYVADVTRNWKGVAHWIPGRPVRGFFGGLRLAWGAWGKREAMTARRCGSCGRLELYAVDPESIATGP